MRQYTWLKVNNNRVMATRLDRMYVSRQLSNQIIDCSIIPMGFTDHNLVSVVISKSQSSNKSSFWHFNIRLLQDKSFCRFFEIFWQKWKMKKSSFENLRQWWDIGKVNIKTFACSILPNLLMC